MKAVTENPFIQSCKTLFTEKLEPCLQKLYAPQIRKKIMAGAVLVFLIGLVISFRAEPDILSNISIGPLLLLFFVMTPLTIILMTSELKYSVLLLGKDITFKDAAETTILASAANMLPMPGSALVKITRLKALGVTYKHGISVTSFLGVLWIGISLIYVGCWVVLLDFPGTGAGIAVIGLIIMAATVTILYSLYKNTSHLLKLVLTRVAMTLTAAIRLYLCFMALSVSASFAQSSILVASVPLGSAIAIFPSGIGLVEIIAAGIAPLISLSAGSAYLASALNRISRIIIILAASFALSLYAKDQGE